MKRILWLSLSLLLAIGAVAQTQQGYVKTKGRLVNGNVVAGQRIAGAIVQVKGRSAVVSKNGGTFSFPVPTTKKYSLQSVKKQGYVLADPDILSKQYSYSSNPLILVLELPSQQMEDKLSAERKLRRTLSRQLQQREDEIERLREQNELTEEQYHKTLQDLYAEQERSLNLVSQMAERYSKIDFDQLDEFNRRISECIIEGRLYEADSLIKSKGNLMVRINIFNKHHEANVEARKRLEDSEAMELKDREDLAQDCYNQFLIHKLQHHPDSAAYYIEQRAMLDTTNVDWLYDAACYLKECGKKTDACNLFLTANRQIESSGLENLLKHALILNSIAELRNTDEEAIDYYNRAISKLTQINRNHPELIGCYWRLARCYSRSVKVGETISEQWLQNKKKAEEIACWIFDNKEIMNEKDVYLDVLPMTSVDMYNKTVRYYEKALNKISSQNGDNNETIVRIHMKLGDLDEESNLLSHYYTAYQIQNEIDSLHPIMGDICFEIARHYCHQKYLLNNAVEMKDIVMSQQYYHQAISIWKMNYGDYYEKLGNAYNGLSLSYEMAGDYSKAIDCCLYILDLSIIHYGEKSVGSIYGKISNLYCKMGEYEKAIEYRQLKHQYGGYWCVPIFDKNGVCLFNGPSNYEYYEELGDLYYLLNNHQESLESYRTMLDELEKEMGLLYNVRFDLDDYGISYCLRLKEYVAKGNGYIGTAYMSLGDSINALEHYKKSILAIEKIMETDNSETHVDYKMYSEKILSQDKLEDALPVYINLLNLIDTADVKASLKDVAKGILTRIDKLQSHSE